MPRKPAARLRARRAAARVLVSATLAMAKGGRPLMTRVLPVAAEPEIWAHYPAEDAVDAESGARWFYHAHPPEERGPGEHGHFHLFLDRSAFADAGAPLAGPADDGAARADVVHVIGVAVDPVGLPVRFFTVNRWVTDERLYPADAIRARLTSFELRHAPGDPLVNAWLTALVAVFADEIGMALAARDAALAQAGDCFEDRGLELLSTVDIDLDRAVELAGDSDAVAA